MPSLVEECVGAVWQMAPRQDGQRVDDVSQVRFGWLDVVDSLRQSCCHLWRVGNSGGLVRFRSHGTRHRHTIRFHLPHGVWFARRFWSTHDLSTWALDAVARPPSAPSSLDFGVESFQFHAGVFDTKLPIDAALFAVRLVRPGCNFSLQYGQFTDAAVAETLAP